MQHGGDHLGLRRARRRGCLGIIILVWPELLHLTQCIYLSVLESQLPHETVIIHSKQQVDDFVGGLTSPPCGDARQMQHGGDHLGLRRARRRQPLYHQTGVARTSVFSPIARTPPPAVTSVRL